LTLRIWLQVSFGEYTSTGCPTSFPQVISVGATWNRSLWSAVGQAVSDETRGLYAQGSAIGWEGGLFLWAPNINPFRDPRWGRGQEGPSEDPYACAECRQREPNSQSRGCGLLTRR
jgi:beta-glucosidase-like glycosyl hydrolase